MNSLCSWGREPIRFASRLLGLLLIFVLGILAKSLWHVLAKDRNYLTALESSMRQYPIAVDYYWGPVAIRHTVAAFTEGQRCNVR